MVTLVQVVNETVNSILRVPRTSETFRRISLSFPNEIPAREQTSLLPKLRVQYAYCCLTWDCVLNTSQSEDNAVSTGSIALRQSVFDFIRHLICEFFKTRFQFYRLNGCGLGPCSGNVRLRSAIHLNRRQGRNRVFQTRTNMPQSTFS